MSTESSGLLDDVSLSEQGLRSIAVHVVLYGMAVLFLLPYWWMFTTSLKPREQIYSSVPHLFPSEITFEAYRLLLSDSQIVQWTVNTIILATLTTVTVLIIDSMIAYSLTRLEWPGRNVVFTVIVASFLVPGIVNLVPVFLIVAELGLVNNLFGVVLPSVANPLGVFMLYQFFRDIPEELEEAARLDGFSRLRIFTHIILPLMRSALAALGLFIFIWTWNAFLWPLVILQDSSLYTLPIGLVTLQDNMGIANPGIVMASAVIASLPLLLVFLLLQRHLIKAVEAQGTVK
ncbi:carbohydrate ABC transporter permease [Halopelagius longus]|uniref:Carbohydrate ABC transporter membrane protein 2, CUT1 family n=1 Tax=Halopelagius longus TaxID=1236180 RepID=A0A1H1FMI5_9EURY|nr:carbohydrate ABC transporter permease [Halopelagius longus]RDI70028.1 carbohydrate ABC transporter permease [Halopelagius longus]SDR02100.1 carbohydrate ABC transporter membrane protein 2, CUT1 family [Halopelagius longus]